MQVQTDLYHLNKVCESKSLEILETYFFLFLFLHARVCGVIADQIFQRIEFPMIVFGDLIYFGSFVFSVALISASFMVFKIQFCCKYFSELLVKPQQFGLLNHIFWVCSATAVTRDSWEKSVVKSDIPVLVEFYASWCGPCRMVHRVIDEIAAEYDGKLKCFVLNTDNDLQIAEDYEIKAVPVVLLLKNGEKRESVVGTMPKEFYIAAIERVMRS